MKRITGLMLTRKDIGLVMSVSFTDIDEATGQIISANQTMSKVLLSDGEQSVVAGVFSIAQEFINDR